MRCESPGLHRISFDAHEEAIDASSIAVSQWVNWLAIPCSTHHCTKWDRLSSCVRQPGHTALRRHSQETVVCCVPKFVFPKSKITKIVATIWCVAMPDISVCATFQSSQTLECPYPDQTGAAVQVTHCLWY